MKTPLARSLRYWGMALVLCGALAYARRVPWAQAIATMRGASTWLLALALVFHLVALAGKAGIWWTFLRPLGGPPFATVARGTLVGATLNSLFVGSSGEAGRVLLMTRLTGIPSASVVATVVLERMVDLCGFLAMLLCAVVLFHVPHAFGIGALAVLGSASAAILVQRALRTRGESRFLLQIASAAWIRRLRSYLQHVFASARQIATTRRLVITVVLTLLDWCSELLSYSLVARAAHFPIGVRGSLLVLLAVNVSFLIRVTPGNVGVFELVYASVATSLGFAADQAIGVGLLLHLVQDVPTALLGLGLGNRLFSIRTPPAMGARRAPASRPHGAAILPLAAPNVEPVRSILR